VSVERLAVGRVDRRLRALAALSVVVPTAGCFVV
jgi:hypothetical protein